MTSHCSRPFAASSPEPRRACEPLGIFAGFDCVADDAAGIRAAPVRRDRRRRRSDRRGGDIPAGAARGLVHSSRLGGEGELVMEARHEVARDPQPGEPRSALVDNGVFVKQVLRPGSLQDGEGLSLATEYGVLLPGVNAQEGTGISLAGIASQRGPAGTVHLNTQILKTREHESELFLGTILEGPYTWRVRPVSEVFTDRTSGSSRVNSALVGAIWRVREGFSFDAALRFAHAGGQSIQEFRLGFTWSFEYRKEG